MVGNTDSSSYATRAFVDFVWNVTQSEGQSLQ